MIAKELFNISRVVDDGNFHIVLESNVPRKLELISEIPVCCRIVLEGQDPPIHIRCTGIDKKDNMRVYMSYRRHEPTMEKHDMSWVGFKGPILKIAGERGPKPNTKVFNTPSLFLTFISSLGANLEVRPAFIDPAKANSIKYVTTTQTNKYDQSATGVDEPKIPPQKTMLEHFKSNKQNYTDIKTMIEETKKKENETFADDVILAAQAIRDKREQSKAKKDF